MAETSNGDRTCSDCLFWTQAEVNGYKVHGMMCGVTSRILSGEIMPKGEAKIYSPGDGQLICGPDFGCNRHSREP